MIQSTKINYEVILMYTGASKLATTSIVLGAINIFCVLPVLLYISNHSKMPWSYAFAASLALLASAVALILTACALRSAAQDLNMNDETYIIKINDLKKRVDELEIRVKQ